ncbi:ficolin-1-like [Dreissena polymorpha]|uniref:Fibrinogen C-terminal domain-containing protein n=1 Tax=Dreissena polymorpha TaxID=45954 RepID=A0A9D4CRE8_DREPO|nr:ficolin-1-like [Dreissena polymorpha]KAH3728885.1 hypothetical protein DPMN_054848 [Dreissena polymorpha]
MCMTSNMYDLMNWTILLFSVTMIRCNQGGKGNPLKKQLLDIGLKIDELDFKVDDVKNHLVEQDKTMKFDRTRNNEVIEQLADRINKLIEIVKYHFAQDSITRDDIYTIDIVSNKTSADKDLHDEHQVIWEKLKLIEREMYAVRKTYKDHVEACGITNAKLASTVHQLQAVNAANCENAITKTGVTESTTAEENPSPCRNASKSGVITINVNYQNITHLNVCCDMTTDGGGWTVIQRRMDGSLNFFRDWESYKRGFGDVTGEFWLGNEHLYQLTSNRPRELRVDMEDFEGNKAFAKYSFFEVLPEFYSYAIRIDGFNGSAGNSLKYHNDHGFSTKDRDNDGSSGSCAHYWQGAWWFDECLRSHLNGEYKVETLEAYRGIVWDAWKGPKYSLKWVEMKFR